MKIEIIRPDRDFDCVDGKIISGGKVEGDAIVNAGRLIVEKADYYICPDSSGNYSPQPIPQGNFDLPFLILGYHGKGMTFEQGAIEGIKFLEQSCNEFEKSLKEAGCKEVVKIVKFPVDCIEKEKEAVVAEECLFIGINQGETNESWMDKWSSWVY